MKIKLAISFLLLFSFFDIRAQTNPCGVVAAMIPTQDTVVYIPNQLIFLQNASVNATDFRFLYGGGTYPLNSEFNIGVAPGVNVVKLVAYNGACTDTVTRYIFNPGIYPSDTDNYRMVYGYETREHEITDLNSVAGGYLVSGIRKASSFFMEPAEGLIIKTKAEGCVDWGRRIETLFGSVVYSVKEAIDGSVYFFGESDGQYHVVGKLDMNGNLLWAKALEYSPTIRLAIHGIYTMPDGDLIVVGNRNNVDVGIVRLNPNGDIVWQKDLDFDFSFSGGFHHVLYKDGFLYVGGDASYNNSTQQDAFLTKMVYSDGGTIWSNKYESNFGTINLRNIVNEDSVLLINISGSAGSPNLETVTGFMRVDTSGVVQSAALITNNYTPNTLVGPFTPIRSSLIKSGNSYYLHAFGYMTLSLQPGIGYTSYLIRLGENYQSKWMISDGGIGAVRFFNLTSAPEDGAMLGGIELSQGEDFTSYSSKIVMKPVDTSGENFNSQWCYSSTSLPQFTNLTVTPTPVQWNLDQTASYSIINAPLRVVPFYPKMRFKCPDYVDSCSLLRLSGNRSVCNLNQDYTYTVSKNDGCGQPTQWQLPTGASLVSQTSNSITVRFATFGRYVIYGRNLLSCTPVEDSIVILAESRTPPLELGAAADLCPQNSMTLRAGHQFFSYLWQDGSTDSNLVINQPGLYWVEVMDSCSNILRDTILVNPAPPIPVSIGPDLQKCNEETIQLQAPSGFINYFWEPDYNINSLTGASVVVQPDVDTSYILRAEKTPGCFAYDTIFIKVYHSPPIDLGPDQRFCSGDSVLLNAGPGFESYQWSNGNQNMAFYAYNQGTYTVTGTTLEGCESTDMVEILPAFILPQPQLDQNNVLCEGTTRTLNPGSQYLSYQWNTGATTASIVVSDRGVYRVEVTDNNGCKGVADTEIDHIQPHPTHFLIEDTTICSYGTLDLKALKNYSHYLWNTGSTNSQIRISTPGTYWLEVIDEENCLGKDTVVVILKECMKGLFVPSAFTPNQDGKNDLLRPLLFGQIEKFEFLVYNRWGQVVYRSVTPGEGWDGRLAGKDQDTNAFVWICRYKLFGEPEQVERGTVVLIR